MTRTRSIGARSDFSERTRAGGDAEDGGDGDGDDDVQSASHPDAPSRAWSIYKEDDANADAGLPRPEDDPDDPINKYVSDQLARIKSNESHEFAEELAASNDGANDDL